MLSLFKRYRLSRSAVPHISAFTFMTVCERVKPMSRVEFEFAQHSLELSSEWLYQQQSTPNYADAGHIVIEDKADFRFEDLISRNLALSSVPVVLANCHEVLLKALPVIVLDNDEVGIIHIGHELALKQSLEPQVGSVFHFALSRFANVRLFYMGIDPERVSGPMLEYAEDLGCNWVTHQESQFRHRSQLKTQLNHYMQHCDQLVLNIDLASLVPGRSLDDHAVLDLQMVLRVVRHAVLSGKVRMIQLVGAKDKLIYSKQTKAIVDELCALSAEVTVSE
ncbi:arginase [Vibrio sp. H11]|uniref:arginase n=1 Tax=Vibrio sp. H11 TaxID=2565928 RepID=UPI0010A5A7C1|nr:arginase [Vibrio sp. H11]